MVYAALGDGRRLLKDCNAVAVLYSLLKKEQSGTRLAERTGLRKCEDFLCERWCTVVKRPLARVWGFAILRDWYSMVFFTTKSNQASRQNILN
jgi:hypothetical protein